MSWNTAFTRFKSSGLAGLDCGAYLKVPRRDEDIEIVEVYDGDIEVGQCVSMVRIPAGARITGMELTWGGGSGDATLGVGDPYACARFLGPVSTARDSGLMNFPNSGCLPYGTCGKLMKTGRVGDGCGLFYQYTCETDLIITNLYHAGWANLGGWAGAVGPADHVSAKWTGGRIVLNVQYKQAS